MPGVYTREIDLSERVPMIGTLYLYDDYKELEEYRKLGTSEEISYLLELLCMVLDNSFLSERGKKEIRKWVDRKEKTQEPQLITPLEDELFEI